MKKKRGEIEQVGNFKIERNQAEILLQNNSDYIFFQIIEHMRFFSSIELF